MSIYFPIPNHLENAKFSGVLLGENPDSNLIGADIRLLCPTKNIVYVYCVSSSTGPARLAPPIYTAEHMINNYGFRPWITTVRFLVYMILPCKKLYSFRVVWSVLDPWPHVDCCLQRNRDHTNPYIRMIYSVWAGNDLIIDIIWSNHSGIWSFVVSLNGIRFHRKKNWMFTPFLNFSLLG